MKRVLIAGLALSILGGTAASAQPYRYDDYNARRDIQEQRRDIREQQRDLRQDRKELRRDVRRWKKGQRLSANYYNSRSHYVDYRRHHLRQPPRGYQWVNVNNDYLLVALATGLIASVVSH